MLTERIFEFDFPVYLIWLDINMKNKREGVPLVRILYISSTRFFKSGFWFFGLQRQSDNDR